MKFTLRSPCKYCITKSMCDNVCNGFRNYGIHVHDTLYVLYGIALILAIASLLYISYIILPASFVHGMITSVLILGYYTSYKIINEDYDPDEDWNKLFLYIVGPFLFLMSMTWDEIPVDKPIDDFIYKHIKKHQPNKG